MPSLAASVARVEFVTPDGELHALARGDADFEGAVVSLGALGVMVAIDLDIVPSFEIAQTVFEGLPWDGVLADLDAVTGLGYSTSMFTTWRDADVVDQLWMKARVDAGAAVPDEVLGARPAPVDRHPLPGVSAVNCTPQLGSAGPWLDRLPHFRMGFQPSNGEELQSEYLVPRRHAVDALGTLRSLAGRIAPLLQVCEVRTVAADALWLSSSYETDAVAMHFTWLPDQPGVEAFLPDLEAALAPFARPAALGQALRPARRRRALPAVRTTSRRCANGSIRAECCATSGSPSSGSESVPRREDAGRRDAPVHDDVGLHVVVRLSRTRRRRSSRRSWPGRPSCRTRRRPASRTAGHPTGSSSSRWTTRRRCARAAAASAR